MSTLKDILSKEVEMVLSHTGVGIAALKSLSVGKNNVSELTQVPSGIYVKIGSEEYIIPYTNILYIKLVK